ncbi:MAG: ComF family protein [Burkholderiaceae bacterium]
MPRLPALFTDAIGRCLRPDCLACGRVPGDPVCAACRADYFPSEVRRCRRCALAIPFGEICGACLRHPPHFDASLACADYLPPVAGMIVALKSGGRLELAQPLAELLAQHCANQLDTATIVTAVPLAFERHSERGFNQSAEVARIAARRLGLALDLDLLLRVKHSPPQQSLALAARRRNVRGAYATSRQLTGESVAVIDDVMTTGATLDEIAATLKRAGAGRVTNLVLARTP